MVMINDTKIIKNKIHPTSCSCCGEKSSLTPPLGNIASYSPPKRKKKSELTEKELNTLKYSIRKENYKVKEMSGKLVPRVSYCGQRTINKNSTFVNAVKGEKGSIYYENMQRCGSVWFCPICMFKLMKGRSEDLYEQLQSYKKKNKLILFVTFTIQHKKSDRLEYLHETLLGAFNFANKHGSWIKEKKKIPIEYLRTLEVLYGRNGWHPHLHSVFIGDEEIINSINVFINLYKKYLKSKNLVINEHTVVVDKWNGKLDDMTDYIFKGMMEKELHGGNLTKSGKGLNYFELLKNKYDVQAKEYVEVMKGKRQFHKSKNFFCDIVEKTEAEILTDDKVAEILFTIPVPTFADMIKKKIALHFLNEWQYGGNERAIRLMELYDCDYSFMQQKIPIPHIHIV